MSTDGGYRQSLTLLFTHLNVGKAERKRHSSRSVALSFAANCLPVGMLLLACLPHSLVRVVCQSRDGRAVTLAPFPDVRRVTNYIGSFAMNFRNEIVENSNANHRQFRQYIEHNRECFMPRCVPSFAINCRLC